VAKWSNYWTADAVADAVADDDDDDDDDDVQLLLKILPSSTSPSAVSVICRRYKSPWRNKGG